MGDPGPGFRCSPEKGPIVHAKNLNQDRRVHRIGAGRIDALKNAYDTKLSK
jgi:hypothetical protein